MTQILKFLELLKVMEQPVPYTYCKGENGLECAKEIENQPAANKTCKCNEKDGNMTFTIPKDGWKGDVFIYYELENFYQNHRRYVKSRDDKQLLGNKKLEDGVNTDCQPFDKCKKDANDNECVNGENSNLADGTPFLPCGAIANSLFSGKIINIYKVVHHNYLD